MEGQRNMDVKKDRETWGRDKEKRKIDKKKDREAWT